MLTPSELKTLRRLLDKAGSKTEFQREVKRARQLPKRGRGRPARNDDDSILFVLELCCLVGKWAGIKRNTVLRAALARKDSQFGKTNNAAVHRLAKRLRDPDFKKRFNAADRRIPKDLRDPDLKKRLKDEDERLSSTPDEYLSAMQTEPPLNPEIFTLMTQIWDRGPPPDDDAARKMKSWRKEHLKSIAR
jgi:hypothetical protein